MLLLRMVGERFHRDTEGRPIREGRTPPELLKEGEIEYRQCPYSGSRYLHANPMNVSALRQMSSHWDEMIDTISFLRDIYKEARGDYRFDLMDIWRVGQMGSALPWFFILKRDEICPAYVAGLSKATLGVGIWGARELCDEIAARTFKVPGPRWTARQIYESSDANETLIATDEVCSASDKMIEKFFEPYVDLVPFGSTGDTARLPAMRDEILRFGAHYIAFKQWIWTYWLARRMLVQDVEAVTGPRSEYEGHLDPHAEPPDFFLIQPSNPTELPLAHRAAWFASLGALVEPFLPDGSDAPYRLQLAKLALIMGQEPADLDALTAQVRTKISDETGARQIARAAGMFAQLDALHGEVIATTEAGFRGDTTATIDAEVRDRVLRNVPRALFASYLA